MYCIRFHGPARSQRKENKAVQSAEAGFLKIVVVIARSRRALALTVFSTMLVSAGLVLLIPVSYTGTAVILAPQPSSTASALLSQLGSLSSLSPDVMEGGGVKTPEETYLGILSSRTIADEMIRRFNLQSLYRNQPHGRYPKSTGQAYPCGSAPRAILSASM